MEALAAYIRSRQTWDKPFHYNGCNAVPEGNWPECCYRHDFDYQSGGWADFSLSWCILKNKNPFAAVLFFIGVRFGGMWAFKWGKKRELFDTEGRKLKRPSI